MAIAKMEKLKLTFGAGHLDDVLHLMQGFQGIHIETGIESTIPQARRVEIEKDIHEIEKTLQKIYTANSILTSWKPANMFSALKGGEERRLSAAQLTEIVEGSDWEEILDNILQTDRKLQDNRARRQEITKLFDKLEIWEKFACNPLEFAKFQRTAAFMGSVHKKHAAEFSEHLSLLEEEGVGYENVAEREDRVYFLLLCHRSMEGKLGTLMDEFSFSPEEYPFDKPQAKAKRTLDEEERQLVEEEREIDELLVEQAKHGEILALAEDYNLNTLLRKKKALEVTFDGEDIVISGWILSDKREQFERRLASRVPKAGYRIFFSQVKDKDIDHVPIKLQNGRLTTVYERLIEMYSLPKYNEIDPTPIMTIFYFVFFGLMVADVGYGLTICLLGLLIKRFLKLKRSRRSLVDFLFYLSFPIMGWGLVCGSIFGLDLPFGLLSIRVDIIPMTILSIGFGYLHIMTGLVLQMINQIKRGNTYDMLTGGLSWFLIFLGGAAALLTTLVPQLESAALRWAGLAVLGVGLAIVLLVPAVQRGKKWYMGLGSGLYALYGATSYLGDFVSYTRLMALGVAGGSVALAFNTILSYLALPARLTLGVVLAIILHGLNMFLTMLSAYVHGIRLQFIEFFGKFYAGGGKRFEPFKTAEKNVIIIEND